MLISKNWKNIQDGGQRPKTNPKAFGSLPPCGNRCRSSESAICSSRVHPPSEITSNFKFKTLRWRLLRWRVTLSDSHPCQDPSHGWDNSGIHHGRKGGFFSSPAGQKYHWGQNDYLPNFYSRQIILGNSMPLMCTKEKFQGNSY